MILRTFASLIMALLITTATVAAQDHTAVVAQAKADLLALHQDLTGPCGAFILTNLVAFRLQSEGYGILEKPNGNNCQGYSVDVVVQRDGRIWDVLANSGGDEDANGNPIPGTGNVPVWQLGTPVNASRWRQPLDPGIDGPPVDPAPTPDIDLVLLVSRVETLERTDHTYANELAGLTAYVAELQRLLTTAVERVLVLESKPEPKVPTCRASANLGFVRIPVSCTVVP